MERCWSGAEALNRFGESLRGLLWSRVRLTGAALGEGLRLGPECSDRRKASASFGSWKESWSPFGALSRRVAGKAKVNLSC